MADFKQAYAAIVEGHEGGYVLDEEDPGGETWRGVARRRNPQWPGWALIDEHKASGVGGLQDRLAADTTLQLHVEAIYKSNYWDVFYGDHMPWAPVAIELFDGEVNAGRGILFLQQALNKLNRKERDWSNIAEDGGFGKITFATLKRAVEVRDVAMVVQLQNAAQSHHYWSLMDRAEKFEKYVGWWARTRSEVV